MSCIRILLILGFSSLVSHAEWNAFRIDTAPETAAPQRAN